MPSFKADFNELIERIRRGRDFGHAGFEPVHYLIFPPKYILDIKRQTPAWIAKLRNEGWEVTVFSIAQHTSDILKKSPLRKIWLVADKKSPLSWEKTNKSLANALADGSLQSQLESVLENLEKQKNAILFVTDLEALHPFMRIGAIESQLQGKFKVPTIFLYPGQRTGKTQLKFLGFYPEDGNYRSVHVGG
jgi:hypothetical protein